MNWKNALLATATAAMAVTAAPAAMTQDAAQAQRPVFDIPDTITIFGREIPPVVKATAIVNGAVITQTDINERMNFMLVASGQQIPPEQVADMRQQVLANLIDETLQIQAAAAEEINISDEEVARTLAAVAEDSGRTVEELAALLEQNGASLETMRQQIRGEIAWSRLQQYKIENFVSVDDDEVRAVLAKLEASKGTTEYRVGEIFLSATPANDQQVRENALRVLDLIRQGASFVAVARQYSEASHAAVGGDLGWIRPEQLPAELAQALPQIQLGSVSVPIKIPGGYSILAVQDRRTILTADPRDAQLSLKQVAIPLQQGISVEAANAIVDRFAEAATNLGGCGGAEKLASDFGGQVLSRDDVSMRELPPELQQMMIPMQVGQATRPFGSLEEGVRVLVLCGREEATPGLPSFAEVQQQKRAERINSRARRYLRDLRRDAVIDYR
ncbi:peptidylprolyl isomerase [Sphingomicrobium clamense]|uniref:Peptidylprolyl isomerase n=1 Tax=Sphingomicrobium clamense TaxID=2851013 RepID=A0ABS6V5Y3_9SPHN|nr:peptidylprolyl isomerase [Sphingomicrobium sp. B8]MBW0144981.1 peptidylprolyl isomerase [Sphingomicrobium sp. B8]